MSIDDSTKKFISRLSDEELKKVFKDKPSEYTKEETAFIGEELRKRGFKAENETPQARISQFPDSSAYRGQDSLLRKPALFKNKIILFELVTLFVIVLLIIFNNPTDKSYVPSSNESNYLKEKSNKLPLNRLNLKKGLLDVRWDDDSISTKEKIEKYPNVVYKSKSNVPDFEVKNGHVDLTGGSHPDSADYIKFEGGDLCGFKVDQWCFNYSDNGRIYRISVRFDNRAIENVEEAFQKMGTIVDSELGPHEKHTINILKVAEWNEWNVRIDSVRYILVFLDRSLNLDIQLKYIDTSSHIERKDYELSNDIVDSTFFGLLCYGMTINQIKGLSNIYLEGLTDFEHFQGRLSNISRRAVYFEDSVTLSIVFDKWETAQAVLIDHFGESGRWDRPITSVGRSEIKRIKEYFTRLYGSPSYEKDQEMANTIWHSRSSDIVLSQMIFKDNHSKTEYEPDLMFIPLGDWKKNPHIF